MSKKINWLQSQSDQTKMVLGALLLVVVTILSSFMYSALSAYAGQRAAVVVMTLPLAVLAVASIMHQHTNRK